MRESKTSDCIHRNTIIYVYFSRKYIVSISDAHISVVFFMTI